MQQITPNLAHLTNPAWRETMKNHLSLGQEEAM